MTNGEWGIGIKTNREWSAWREEPSPSLSLEGRGN
jgi:hypothetical protein